MASATVAATFQRAPQLACSVRSRLGIYVNDNMFGSRAVSTICETSIAPLRKRGNPWRFAAPRLPFIFDNIVGDSYPRYSLHISNRRRVVVFSAALVLLLGSFCLHAVVSAGWYRHERSQRLQAHEHQLPPTGVCAQSLEATQADLTYLNLPLLGY